MFKNITTLCRFLHLMRANQIKTPAELLKWQNKHITSDSLSIEKMLFKILPGHLFEKEKIAFFYQDDNPFQYVNKLPRVELVFFNLKEKMSTLLVQLHQLNPTILIAPPAVLRFIYASISKHKITTIPKKVIAFPEALHDSERRNLEKNFGQTVHQITENFIASTCDEGKLHLNEDFYIIEKEYINRKKNVFCPIVNGVKTDIVLTESPTTCTCRSILTPIQSYQGKYRNILFGNSLKEEKQIPIFPDEIATAFIHTRICFTKLKLVQSSPKDLHIFVPREDFYKETTLETIRANIDYLFELNDSYAPYISFHPYNH